MPEGRKPIITDIILRIKEKKLMKKTKEELKIGSQLYVICPRIDEPDPDKEKALQLKALRKKLKRLKKNIFKEYNIDILHSKMTKKRKNL